ncbi:C2H2-type zinc-finger protein (macronuclear) [Tetrahymena thermophila SB210]|uniref:C2H2-type zinc-finger protein n=1 Tax=Tetrahymena thermophila (strain SB210) TaxID=312017 RepID=I7M0Y5_TETTS|nr:C2H2-type zinc-finger protein [Tetrahymena thermophila SB210]EAR92944.2 C2H2-type zinc-finger protein [Tetrahymena thermophila SB210]|eukprot:XP_001013189.2 C2H2-type zinc-finger protein [Tetrahymena thermophila SB210]
MSYDRESSTLRKETYNLIGQQATSLYGIPNNDDIFLDNNEINSINYVQKINGNISNSLANPPYGILTQQIIQQSNNKPTLISNQLSYEDDGLLEKTNMNYYNHHINNIGNLNQRNNYQQHSNFQAPLFQSSNINPNNSNTTQNQGSMQFNTNAANTNNSMIVQGQNQNLQQHQVGNNHLLMSYNNNNIGFNYSDMIDQYQNYEEIKNGNDEEYCLNSQNTSSQEEGNKQDQNNNNPDNNNNANENGSEKQYICEYEECKKIFKAKKSLRDHIRIHTNQRPYSCVEPNCGKSFVQYSSLQKHSRTHKGDRPYKCDYFECDQAFTQVSNLKRHQKIHLNDKPYECNQCLRKFTTSSNLKQHQITHESQKERQRFKCQIDECGKSYLYSSSLKKHEKEHILNQNPKGLHRINMVRQVNQNCEMHGQKPTQQQKVDNNIYSENGFDEEEEDEEELMNQEQEELEERDEDEEEFDEIDEQNELNQKKSKDATKRENSGENKQQHLSHLSGDSSNSQGQMQKYKKKNITAQQALDNQQYNNQQQIKPAHIQQNQSRINTEEMDMLNQFFYSHHIALQHDGHYDVLFKGYLYHYNKKTGKIEIHDIQAQDEIKKGTCQPLSELTHNTYDDVQKKINELEYRFRDQDILSQACNPLSCQCGINGSKGCCSSEGKASCQCASSGCNNQDSIQNKVQISEGCCSSNNSKQQQEQKQSQIKNERQQTIQQDKCDAEQNNLICCNEPECAADNVVLVTGNIEKPVCCVKSDERFEIKSKPIKECVCSSKQNKNSQQPSLNEEVAVNQSQQGQQVKDEDQCCCTIDEVKVECTCIGCDEDCSSCSKSTKCIYKIQYPQEQSNKIIPEEQIQQKAQNPQQEQSQLNEQNSYDQRNYQPDQYIEQQQQHHHHQTYIQAQINANLYEINEPKDYQNDKKQPKCICNETKDLKHSHGPNCGHIPIYHHGHLDYIVENQLHHPHGSHCDFHGTVNILENCVKI